MNFEDMTKELTDVKGVRTYTDKDGKFHLTTKSIEQEKKEKEQKLTYEKGPICSLCEKRNKSFRYDINKNLVCNKCYDKIWEEHYINEENITINVVCPICNDNLNISFESRGACQCGTIYSAGYEDEFYYVVRFYKKKGIENALHTMG